MVIPPKCGTGVTGLCALSGPLPKKRTTERTERKKARKEHVCEGLTVLVAAHIFIFISPMR